MWASWATTMQAACTAANLRVPESMRSALEPLRVTLTEHRRGAKQQRHDARAKVQEPAARRPRLEK